MEDTQICKHLVHGYVPGDLPLGQIGEKRGCPITHDVDSADEDEDQTESADEDQTESADDDQDKNTEPVSLDNMTKEELIALIQSREVPMSYPKGYQSTNPGDKDELKHIFAQHLDIHSTGVIVILEHTEFKTARRLGKEGISPSRIRIPQYEKKIYDEMKRDPTFGPCVEFMTLIQLLTILSESHTPVAGIYADLTCTYNGGIDNLNAMASVSFCSGAVVGITICLRTAKAKEHPYKDVIDLSEYMHERFPGSKNLIREHAFPDGIQKNVYVYGTKSRMATILRKL